MSLNRRRFLRYAAAIGAASVLPSDGFAAAQSLPPSPGNGDDEEAYWFAVRALFPLTRDWAYLNTGTVGPSPYPVIEAVREGMMQTDALGHYNGFEELPKLLAAFLGADKEEIALTHNTTEGINIMCRGLSLRRGDEVILSAHEHVGNAFPWLNRAKQEGIIIRAFAPGPSAAETFANLEALCTGRTRAIAIPHIPCTQGQVMPLPEICAYARRRGILTLIDGAHGAGMMPLDLHAIGADAYAGCCHKWMLGPKGTGFLYVHRESQKVLQPHFVGGGGDTGTWNMATNPIHGTEYAHDAHRYWGGTQNLGLWLGVAAAIDFLNRIGMERIERRVTELGAYTQQQLLTLGERITVLTPAENRSRRGITGFRVAGISHDEVFRKCMDAKVRIRAVSENGWNALRVSTHFYNSREDVNKLVDVVKRLL